MSYHHFTIDERESILSYRTQRDNLFSIARLWQRHPSSISREVQRHSKQGNYSRAQTVYRLTKSHCGRKRKLEPDHVNTVRPSSLFS